jgi:hypothetical protein
VRLASTSITHSASAKPAKLNWNSGVGIMWPAGASMS